MNILYAASEALPFAASGGLADVAGSLPGALVENGQDCRVVMPLYGNIREDMKNSMTYIANFSVPVAWRNQYCGLFTAQYGNVTYYFLDNEYYFKRGSLYGYFDDAERYIFFSRAILEMIKCIDFKPDIINSNDWQTALVPVYYNVFYKNMYGYDNIRHVFTIHNIQYQGKYGFELVSDLLGIPSDKVSILEYDKCINFMKGAIETADKVTTVSPTYATEILDPWFSHGLHNALKDKQYKTCGFLNGIDVSLYNPETDKGIPANFNDKDKKGKTACKSALLKEIGLPDGKEPVIGIVSRFVEHKGFDLIKIVFDQIVNMGFKVAILGSGEMEYENFFREMQNKYSDKVSVTIGYIPSLARKIYAGSDLFLMPSKSEPCGLAQMISLRYGTIPIVRATGGLKDSIVDCGDSKGTGFTFQTYDSYDMLNSIERAAEYYSNRMKWGKLVSHAMRQDFSWNRSAQLYLGLYNEITNW